MKPITLLSLLLAVAAGAVAQSRQSTWTVTPRVGISLSTVAGLEQYAAAGSTAAASGSTAAAGSLPVNWRWGPVAGVDVEGLVSRRLGLSLGMFYSLQGCRLDADAAVAIGGQKADATARLQLHLFSVPLLVDYYVLPGLAVKTGLQADGLIAARTRYAGKSQKLNNAVRSFGLSLPVGVSYDLGPLSLDLRYLVGLTDWCDVGDYHALGDSWHSRSLWLTLGYRIRK